MRPSSSIFNNNATAWTTAFTVTMPGFATGTPTLSLYPPRFSLRLSGATGFNTPSTSSPTTLICAPLILNPSTLTQAGQGTLGPQASPVSYTIISGTPSVGTIIGNPGTFPIGEGNYDQSVNFQPISAGSTVLTLTEPTGYSSPNSPATWPMQLTSTVGP